MDLDTIEFQRLTVRCFVNTAKKLDPSVYLAIEAFNKIVELKAVFQQNLFAHACRHALDCINRKMMDCAITTIKYIMWQWKCVFDYIRLKK
jgi:hypothetical protein